MQNPYAVAPGPPGAGAAPKRYVGKNGAPMYDPAHGGHYGASAHIAGQGHAPPPETFTGHWANVRKSWELLYSSLANFLRRYHKGLVGHTETFSIHIGRTR